MTDVDVRGRIRFFCKRCALRTRRFVDVRCAAAYVCGMVSSSSMLFGERGLCQVTVERFACPDRFKSVARSLGKPIASGWGG